MSAMTVIDFVYQFLLKEEETDADKIKHFTQITNSLHVKGITFREKFTRFWAEKPA